MHQQTDKLQLKKYKQFLQKADKNKVLKALPDLHEQAFEKINCLDCAMCCKNYSPRFKTPDIKRISKHLKQKESEFIETYLRLDKDGDYVVKSTPCLFLRLMIIIAVFMMFVHQIANGFRILMKMCL